jgi:hypothetical protein
VSVISAIALAGANRLVCNVWITIFLDLREYRRVALSIRAPSQLSCKPDAFVNAAANNRMTFSYSVQIKENT